MSIAGLRSRRAAAVVAVGLVAGAAFAAPNAVAAPAADQGQAAVSAADAAAMSTATLATSLTDQLGSRAAGAYQNAQGKLVVNVTDSATAHTVSAAGAVPRYVSRSGVTLDSAMATLNTSAKFAGTSWGVDPASNKVLVTADSTVTGAKLATLKSVVASLGEAARLEITGGTLQPTITGGDAILASGVRCSLAFNGNAPGGPIFITAGHCGNLSATWTNSAGQQLGTRINSSFPGNDYAVYRYNAGFTNRPGAVNLYNGATSDIARSADAVVGQAVQRTGSTSHLHGGTVNGVNTTVTYPQGQVTGLIRTNVCAEPGDSGGSLFAGNVALGITSGGSGNCTSGGTTFFQPVTEALATVGGAVY